VFALFIERCSGVSAEIRRQEAELAVEEAAKEAKEVEEIHFSAL